MIFNFKKKIIFFVFGVAFHLLSMDPPDGISNKEDSYELRFPLHYQVSLGQEQKVKEILEGKKNKINEQDDSGQSPLFKAVLLGNEKLVSLFLKKKAKINLLDIQGVSPLGYALSCGYESIINMLIEKKANPELSMPSGLNATHIAATFNTNSEVIKKILNHNGNPLSLALPTQFPADEWVDKIVVMWINKLNYIKTLEDLEHKNKVDSFFGAVQNIKESKRQAARDRLNGKMDEFRRKKLFDMLQCSVMLYSYLLNSSASISWPNGGRGEKKYTAQKYCEKLEKILDAKIDFFSESPSLDWQVLSEWVEELLEKLQSEDLPEIDGIDFQKVGEWLKKNKTTILKGRLLGQADVDWQDLKCWQENAEKSLRNKNVNLTENQTDILELLKKRIPSKKQSTFSNVLLAIFAQSYSDFDSTSKKFSVQDWVDKMCKALIKSINIDLKPLLYYLLVEDGYQLCVNKRYEDSLVNWSSLIAKLDDEIVNSKIKKFLLHQAYLYSIENHDGFTPLSLSSLVMKHYIPQMIEPGTIFFEQRPEEGEIKKINEKNSSLKEIISDESVYEIDNWDEGEQEALGAAWSKIEKKLIEQESLEVLKVIINSCNEEALEELGSIYEIIEKYFLVPEEDIELQEKLWQLVSHYLDEIDLNNIEIKNEDLLKDVKTIRTISSEWQVIIKRLKDGYMKLHGQFIINFNDVFYSRYGHEWHRFMYYLNPCEKEVIFIDNQGGFSIKRINLACSLQMSETQEDLEQSEKIKLFQEYAKEKLNKLCKNEESERNALLACVRKKKLIENLEKVKTFEGAFKKEPVRLAGFRKGGGSDTDLRNLPTFNRKKSWHNVLKSSKEKRKLLVKSDELDSGERPSLLRRLSSPKLKKKKKSKKNKKTKK